LDKKFAIRLNCGIFNFVRGWWSALRARMEIKERFDEREWVLRKRAFEPRLIRKIWKRMYVDPDGVDKNDKPIPAPLRHQTQT
jgi:hypothetical protein